MAHLSYEQRYTIEMLLKTGSSKPSIARILNVDKSVIYREISRNKDFRSGSYRANLAQRKYESRLKMKSHIVRFTPEIELMVRSYLKDDYSPEQIAGVFKRDDLQGISHEWIYQFIWKDKKKGGVLYQHLRHKGRRYRKRGAKKDSRGILLNRIGISQRPIEANNKSIFGHLEVDTIIGKSHKGAIVTINDRSSGMLWMRKVKTRDALSVSLAMMSLLEQIKPYIRSITADNGKEFALHEKVSESYCDFFFADPYSPWQRGANENLNGLIRQYIPKSSAILEYTDEQIMKIQMKINNRPRKRFCFQSPIFKMNELLFNPKVAFVA